jgi:hypothetical protein
VLKVISSFALNDVVFRAEWQDDQGRKVWRSVTFTGISGDNTLYFRVRGASQPAPTKSSFGGAAPSLPQALQNWEIRVPMKDHGEDLIAAITWRIGPSESGYEVHYYTIEDATILSEVERPEESGERPIPGFRRALEEE